MHINRLDHVNIVTSQLEVMTDWYTQMIGLRVGDRPDFPVAGAWLYAGEHAVVHLVETDDTTLIGSEVDLKMEHVAFSASGRATFESRLVEAGERFRTAEVPAINLIQYNVWDPDGNHLHIDFAADE